jgi:hypothetical protein
MTLEIQVLAWDRHKKVHLTIVLFFHLIIALSVHLTIAGFVHLTIALSIHSMSLTVTMFMFTIELKKN